MNGLVLEMANWGSDVRNEAADTWSGKHKIK